MVWTETHRDGLDILWDTGRDKPAECGRDDYERLCRSAYMLAYGNPEEAKGIRIRLVDNADPPLDSGNTDYYDRTMAFLYAQWEITTKGGHRLWDVDPLAWVGVDGVPNITAERSHWDGVLISARSLAADGWPVFRVWIMENGLPVRMLLARTGTKE